jgi:hypothetical protein
LKKYVICELRRLPGSWQKAAAAVAEATSQRIMPLTGLLGIVEMISSRFARLHLPQIVNASGKKSSFFFVLPLPAPPLLRTHLRGAAARNDKDLG